MVLPRKIFIPLKLKLGRLRILEEVSLTSVCTPSGDPITTDSSQKFECEGETKTKQEITGLYLSSEDGVQSEGKDGKNSTVDLKDINFSEDASKSAKNIDKVDDEEDKTLILQNDKLGTQSWSKFTINGDLVEIENGKTLNLKLHDDATNEDKEILCMVKRKGNDDAVELDCNTNGQNIDAYLYFKRGMEGTTKIFLNMTDEKAKIQITDVNSTTTSYHVNYRKSSSGLSGGAIVGIVIAYAVALIAASIAAMMLRKPIVEQPIDHTTAVQLRTVENI